MAVSIACGADDLELITATGKRLKAEFHEYLYLDADIADLEKVILGDLVETMRMLNQRSTMPGLAPSDMYVWVSTKRPSPPGQLEAMELYMEIEKSTVETELNIIDPVTTDPEAARTLIQEFTEARNIKIIEAEYRKHLSLVDVDPNLVITLEVPCDQSIHMLHDYWNTLYLMLTKDQVNSPDGVRALILAGKIDLLIGQAETEWLEVKRQGYPFENPSKKHEFAMDIAAMANTPTGGILLIGLTTNRDEVGRDLITEVRGCEASTLPIGKYRGVLKQRVVPRIDQIDLQAVPYEDRYILMIYVPPQSKSSQPFIVRGGQIANDRINGDAFTIPYRVNDVRWHMTAEQVQTLLATGSRFQQPDPSNGDAT